MAAAPRTGTMRQNHRSLPDEMAPYAIETTEAEFGKGSVQTISWTEAVTIYNMKP